jgi:hypothetical protein
VESAKGNLSQVASFRVFFYTHHQTVDLSLFPSDWEKTRLENIGCASASWVGVARSSLLRASSDAQLCSRETYAYVTWLIDNLAPHKVHQLSDFLWFSQAAPLRDGWNQKNQWGGIMQRLPLLSPRTGMLGLGLIEMANCEWGGSFTMTPWTHMRDMFVLAQRKICNEGWVTFMNGEFIVSRKRVLHQPLWLFKYIKELLTVRSPRRRGGLVLTLCLARLLHGDRPRLATSSTRRAPQWTGQMCTNRRSRTRCSGTWCARRRAAIRGWLSSDPARLPALRASSDGAALESPI